MTDYLRLRLRQALRSVVVNVPGRMVAFVAFGVVVAVAVQFFVLGQAAESPIGSGVSPSGRLQAEVGYAVLLLAALSLATGPQSSRFPCTPADVAWVYASPLPIGHVIAAQLVWQAVRRCAFWVVGGAVVDVVGTVALDSPPGMFLSRAAGATPLLVALVVLSVGAGSARGSKTPARATTGLGIALGAAVVLPLGLELATGAPAGDAVDGAAASSLARSVGAVLFGEYDASAVATLASMTAVGALLCRAGGPGLREQLTLDAAFWAEFSVTSTPAAVHDPKPSFRGLARLTGPSSILWFEVAVLRRANYQRWSLLLLAVTSVLTGGFAPEFVPLFALVGPLGAVTGAYLSGLARHLRLGTLVLVPGATASRVVAAEAVHGVMACLGLGLSLALGGVTAGYGAGRIATLFVQGAVLLLMAFAVRVAAAALSYRDGTLPGAVFHLTLTLCAAAAVGVVGAISWLASRVDAPWSVTSTAIVLTACGLLAAATGILRDRIAPPPLPPPALRGGQGPVAPRSAQRDSGSASRRSATSSTATTTGLSGS